MISKAVKVGDKVELIKKTHIENLQHSFYSVIQEIRGQDKIIIAAPMEKGKIIPLEIEGDYYLCVYTDRGLYRCEITVTNRSKDNNFFTTTLQVNTKMQKYQRRQYYRLDCVLTFQYKNESKDEWNEGTILDISGGGIRFVSNCQLSSVDHVLCHIILNLENEKKHIYVSGEIVDSDEIDYHAYETRAAFEDISDEVREIIIKFVFDEERKKRKREKGM